METILIMAVTAVLCCGCFALGARVGQKVSKGETVELPTLNPMKAAQERRERQEAEAEKTRMETILHNIDSYDGTGNRQEDVPGR